MWLIIQSLLLVITLIILYGYRIVARIKFRGIPGPQPSWLYGNLPQITHLVNDASKWAEIYGPVFKIFFGGNPVVVVSDPQLAQIVFQNSQHRPNVFSPPTAGPRKKYDREVMYKVHGQKYKTLKSAWQVAFNQGSIHNYFSLMKRHADRLCDVISAKIDNNNNEAFNIHQYIKQMTLEVVGSTAFGIEFGLLNNDQNNNLDNYYGIDSQKILYCLQILMGGILNTSKKSLSPWVITNYLFPELGKLWGQLAYRFPAGEHQKTVEKAFLDFFSQCEKITRRERQKFSSQNNTVTSDNNKSNVIDPGCFLAKILQTKDPDNNGQLLTDEQVCAQVYTFIAGGYDSTAGSVVFTIYLLCKNPDKKLKLFQELGKFVDDDSFTPESLKQCKYLEAVLKESMRVLTPAALISRVTLPPIQLSKYNLPENSNVMINMHSILLDPTIWTKANDFIPERFLEGSDDYEMDKVHPFAYIPFGGGTRMCIGRQYAMQEAKIALFKIYKKFDFELEPGQEKMETVVTVNLAPKNGLKVTALRR